jgi:toxin ParE1/3/4
MHVKGAIISAQAAEDIDEIAAYTTNAWGWRQTDRYLSQLEDCFQLLAGNPSLGRFCDFILPGLRRFEIGKHVVFYDEGDAGILIVRVLHQRMMPAKSRFEG